MSGNRSNFVRLTSTACTAAMIAMAFGSQAHAQAAAPPVAEGATETSDIVVTATRRAEPLQKVPIAISVVGGDILRSENRAGLQGISTIVPSLNFRNTASAKDQALFIRGLGTVSTSPGVEPTVSTVIDGVVLARQGQASMDLMDIDHIEVLRGPQGTLFGKNASVGAVNIVTRAPGDEFHGFFDLGYYTGGDEWRARAGVSGPLGEKVAFSLTGAYSHYDGNVTNVFDNSTVNGFRNAGVRGKLQFKPTEDLTITLIGDYADARNTTPQGVVSSTTLIAYPTNAVTSFPAFATAVAPVVPSAENRSINSNYFTNAEDKNYGLSAQIDWNIGDYTLTSITAWRGWKNDQAQDQDRLPRATTAFAQQHDIGNLHFDQYSQELRLASPKGQFIDYQVGLFYFQGDDTERYQRTTTLGTGASFVGVANYSVSNKSYAGFGEANLHFTERFRGTLGGRVTRDELTYSFARTSTSPTPVTGIQTAFTAGGNTSNTGFSGRAGVQYDLTPKAMAYFTYGRGYKGPAYNVAFSMLPQDTSALSPETSNSFEVGLKSRFFNDMLRFNIAAFLDKFKNYQVNFFDTFNGSPVTRLINAGRVSTRGVEVDVALQPSRAFTLSAGGAYTNARVDNFTCPVGAAASCQINGQPLPYAPKWKGNVRASYEIPLSGDLSIRLTTDANAQSEVQYSINQTPTTVQSAFGIWNASLGLLGGDHWEFNFVVKNITDKSYSTNLGTFGQGVVRFVPRDDRRYVGANFHLAY
ncbi:TonB-dependent receptor [Sphingobium indicum]|uniref:TonB-dependent receptor n=3 Tax=Sphingobium indicum TaxID=332055 RepID=A0A8E0WRN3_9SPHN|nr:MULTISPECIES: TonB-dependent receptor [Sphingobium]KEZ00231.1 TonB-dependent receptor [Sphingomonas sp. BHC-A]APL95993.1 TonB-dependent receptor [Sphingobium indicum B90A]KER36132.1 TonB-dependent receptor [Sphingobium indicum F2]NYI24251.1 iron complex outermembrane receptor protein [Sphingobium indicum]RYL99051.1 TonB-dependent receptor [Sphingobium indicum]